MRGMGNEAHIPPYHRLRLRSCGRLDGLLCSEPTHDHRDGAGSVPAIHPLPCRERAPCGERYPCLGLLDLAAVVPSRAQAMAVDPVRCRSICRAGGGDVCVRDDFGVVAVGILRQKGRNV